MSLLTVTSYSYSYSCWYHACLGIYLVVHTSAQLLLLLPEKRREDYSLIVACACIVHAEALEEDDPKGSLIDIIAPPPCRKVPDEAAAGEGEASGLEKVRRELGRAELTKADLATLMTDVAQRLANVGSD